MHRDALAPSPAAAGEYLSFRLGAEEYGIPILTVQEIRGYTEPTRIAHAPAFMRGVLNLRGVIVPILDLRTKFGQVAAYDEITCTIVLTLADRVLGVVVDAVSDVIAPSAGDIKPAPPMSSGIDGDFVTGIATTGAGRMVILIDLHRLMAGADVGLLASPAQTPVAA